MESASYSQQRTRAYREELHLLLLALGSAGGGSKEGHEDAETKEAEKDDADGGVGVGDNVEVDGVEHDVGETHGGEGAHERGKDKEGEEETSSAGNLAHANHANEGLGVEELVGRADLETNLLEHGVEDTRPVLLSTIVEVLVHVGIKDRGDLVGAGHSEHSNEHESDEDKDSLENGGTEAHDKERRLDRESDRSDGSANMCVVLGRKVKVSEGVRYRIHRKYHITSATLFWMMPEWKIHERRRGTGSDYCCNDDETNHTSTSPPST